MVGVYETIAEKLFPIRWWLLIAFLTLPFLWILGVRYLLFMPGFISPESDWRLLKLSVFFGAWPWGFFLVTVLFHPTHGLLKRRGQRPGLALRTLRTLVLGSLALLFVSPLITLALAP